MKNDNKGKIMHNLDEMGIYIDWIAVLLRDLIESYLMPLAHDCTGKTYTTMQLVESEADRMATKAEMIERFLGEIADHYRAMTDLVFRPGPIPDYKTMTNAERVTEIKSDILKSIDRIATLPDWLDRLKDLNGRAFVLAYPDMYERERTAPDALQIMRNTTTETPKE